MNKEELYKKLTEDGDIKRLTEIFSGTTVEVKLIGGAIIDILEGRSVNDFDILCPNDFANPLSSWVLSPDKMEELGFQFLYDSKTAQTYQWGKHKVQVLKILDSEFDFTISQSSIRLDNYQGGLKHFNIDMCCFKNKKLIPVHYKRPLHTLSRVMHYLDKGYRIENETYLSLINAAKRGVEHKS